MKKSVSLKILLSIPRAPYSEVADFIAKAEWVAIQKSAKAMELSTILRENQDRAYAAVLNLRKAEKAESLAERNEFLFQTALGIVNSSMPKVEFTTVPDSEVQTLGWNLRGKLRQNPVLFGQDTLLKTLTEGLKESAFSELYPVYTKSEAINARLKTVCTKAGEIKNMPLDNVSRDEIQRLIGMLTA